MLAGLTATSTTSTNIGFEYATKTGIPKSGVQNRPIIGIHSGRFWNMMGTAERLYVV